uniref:Uncharacterized protein n=1 Tax=Oryza punctata TaxID=4537 RepID=A0A0E0KV81_ORYPU
MERRSGGDPALPSFSQIWPEGRGHGSDSGRSEGRRFDGGGGGCGSVTATATSTSAARRGLLLFAASHRNDGGDRIRRHDDYGDWIHRREDDSSTAVDQAAAAMTTTTTTATTTAGLLQPPPLYHLAIAVWASADSDHGGLCLRQTSHLAHRVPRSSRRQFFEHLARARQPKESDTDTYSLVMRQTVLFWKVQSHLMAGLKLGLSSMGVPSVAAPVQGSPLMFHGDDDAAACCPSLANTAFTAAAANANASHQPPL